MKHSLKSVLGALSLAALTGMGGGADAGIPFHRSVDADGLLEQDFVVRKAQRYAVNLKYEFATPEIRQRAWAFSGGTDAGAPFTVAVTIVSRGAPAGPALVDTTVTSPTLTSWGADGLYAELVALRLPPGKYTLRVQLAGAQPPPDIPLSVRMVVPYRGK